jgi:S1-C subfamily serine protease
MIRTPFGSALLGGVTAIAFGWIAISAGWIEAEARDPAAPAIPAPIPTADTGGESTTAVGRIYGAAERGVVHVEAEGPSGPTGLFGAPGGGAASGSGFVIDEQGHVVTNHHVVAGAGEIRVILGDSDSFDAKLLGSDPATDLALLEIDAPADELRPLPFGDSSALAVGDPVVAIGDPFGLDRTVTSGIVSALQRQIQAPNGRQISDVIQTDAAINPGNSGGPLLDGRGRVIGVNSQIATAGGQGNVGIGFAVPSNTARKVVGQLLEDGSAEHAFLGISGATIDSELATALNLPTDTGVLVQRVAPDSPAEEAGMRGGDTAAAIDGVQVALGGDVITAVEGQEIASMDDVVSAINGSDPGDELTLEFLRDGEQRRLKVTLGRYG